MLLQIVDIARECGNIIKNASAKKVEIKDQDYRNLVTEYDVKIQNILKEKLAEIIPEASFLGEEGTSDYSKDGYCFVCDPIDGTTNFVKNYKCSSVSIALLKDGHPFMGVIYNPFLDEMFSAEKNKGARCNGKLIKTSEEPLKNSLVAFGTGTYDIEKTWQIMKKYFDISLDIRRSGSGAVDLCNVACGRTGVFWELKLQPWDYAAGALILEEAGGIICDENNKPIADYFQSSSVFAFANERIKIY